MIIDSIPHTNSKKRLSGWIFFLACLVVAEAGAFTGEVADVNSGDTLVVVNEGERHTIGLYGIDAPVSGQQGANAATRYLRGIAMAHPVVLEVIERDGFGRKMAIVKRLGKESSINAAIVANGHAWVNPQTCRTEVCRTWQAYQRQAMKYRLGLWSGFDLTPPWEFREQQRR